MKYFIIVFLLIFISCEEIDCPQCNTPQGPIRITFIDRDGFNMLNPEYENTLDNDVVKSSNNSTINFVPKHDIGGIQLEFWFLESINRPGVDKCVDSECEFYFYYKNIPGIDTLNVYDVTINTDMGNGCYCTSVKRQFIKFNGVEITDYDIETFKTGSAIIIK